MAYGAEPTRANALARVIYVWPSQELMSQSWHWPASWHEAFQDAAGRIGVAAAIYALDGRRFPRRIVSLQLSIGSMQFRVRRRGTGIFITVSEFTAPECRGPDDPDGTRQPGAVDGLILGLHGSDKDHYLVVFHGHMPPVPAEASRAQEGTLRPTACRAAGGDLSPPRLKAHVVGRSGDTEPESITEYPSSIPDGRYRVTGLEPDTSDVPETSPERPDRPGEMRKAGFGQVKIKSRLLH